MTVSKPVDLKIKRRTFVGALSAAGATSVITGAPAFAQSGPITLKWANNIPISHPSNIRVKEAADAVPSSFRRDRHIPALWFDFANSGAFSGYQWFGICV
jgi:hypothetical protein